MRILIKYPVYSLVIVLTALFSCDNHCVDGVGRTTSRTTELDEFEEINFSSWGNIELINSTDHSIKIEAQENIIHLYNFQVRNGTLYINSDNECFNSGTTPKLYISLAHLKGVRLSGSGDLYSADSFETNDLYLTLSGSGKINLKGSSVTQDISISGSGDIDLEDMPSEETKIKISGSGNCRVNVSKKLDVRISGSGDVYYRGNPLINQSISGSGNIKSAN